MRRVRRAERARRAGASARRCAAGTRFEAVKWRRRGELDAAQHDSAQRKPRAELGMQQHTEPPRDAQARALVFIGDAVEEPAPQLLELAGKCRLQGLPLFLFQEGDDAGTRSCFARMAQLSGGAAARFDHGSARRLAELLGAVARYAAGGRPALENSADSGARLLLDQLPR